METYDSMVESSHAEHANVTYTCVIVDMTDASNTCKRHVITLSGTYTIEDLIQEAAKFYAYDASSFNLVYKEANTPLNDPMIRQFRLLDMGLDEGRRNVFEIHEKEGPPKRLKGTADENLVATSCDSDLVEDNGSFFTDSSLTTAPVGYGSRRHAIGSVLTAPVVSPANGGFYYTSATADASSGVSHGSQVEFGPVNMPVLNFDDNNSDYVGLINQAMTCYLNSLLQTLFMTPEFRNGIYRWNCPEEITQEEAKKSIPFQLQRLFLNLQTSNKKSIHTQDLTKSFGWNSDDAFQQHDVQELCRVMFDALEKKFKGTKQENLINELYQGKIKDYVKCLECNTESARVDVFLDIPLCIRPFGSDKTYESVEAALDAFVQPEILDENNKYFCDKCNRMCKAHKGLKFESFPYIISLQLKRFDFDYKTLSRFKLSNTVSFPHILNVKKYLQAEDENKEDGVESVAPTSDEPSSLGAETASDEHNGTDDANKTASQQQNCPHDYELFSIMIHSGSATGGHYYAYIKCFETNQWFNFNDERVSKIDKDDIIKAFGHSYSTYSSTTAYMLLYRQANAKRNEQFIKIDEFDEHLKKLLEKEKNEQIEADRLKEYMENVCKIKTFVNTASMDDLFEANSCDGVMLVSEATNKQPLKRMERVLEIHKDLTIAKAREHILKEFNMEEYLRRTGKKMRILKYDSYNDLVEQSYPNEDTLTVFEAIGFTKCPYNVSWQLEFTPEHEPFVEYYSSDFNVKVCNLNIITLEVNDLFSLRLNSKATISELREKIAQKLNCEPEKVRMALERLHTLNNYTYLNNNLDQTLKGLNFTRVNKVFIEHEDTADLTSSKTFENSKFFYALDTIINMFNMIVYLPNEEQCDMFVKKTQRHQLYLKAHLDSGAAKSAASPSSSIQPPPPPPPQPSAPATDENTQDAYDIASVQSATASTESPKKSASKSIVETPSTTGTADDVDDSASKMSFQETSSHMSSLAFGAKSAMPLIEDHFKTNKPTTVNRGKLVELNLNDMETSLDEGIGSSGSLSNNNLKNSPNSFDNSKLSPICNMDESSPINNDNDNNTTATLSTNVNEGKTKWYDEGFNMKSTGLIGNGSSSLSNDDDEGENLADEADLDVNVDDNEVNNIDDDFNDTNNQPLNNCDDLTDDKDDDIKRKLMELDEGRLSSYRSSYFDHDQNEPQHAGQTLETNNDNRNNHDNDDDDDDSDMLPKYSELKHSAGYQMNKNEIFHDLFNSGANNSSSNVMTGDAYDVNGPVSATDSDTHRDTDNYDNFKTTQSANDVENGINGSNPFSRLHDVRYIKSNLIVNAELGTRTLEIKMDRRIDLMEFKSHIDEYLHIGLVNFRVFRMCPSDVECELTASENQFLYLAQNTKFVIKLGPPLKYGEYVLPVYRLNKSKGTFLYCCDFMIFFRLSVYNHKEMLIDDLKDECNLEISIDKMRLRKKNGKKPGAILLDSEVFGTDIFVNAMTELCIEILDETEKKTSKNQTSVYVRHWKPDEYELGELREEIVEGNSYEQLINHISSISGIPIGDIEVLKCKRDYPFKSPIMDLHRDAAWKDNYFLVMEKLEDGCCFYYRNKTLKLGPISDEKKKEMEKEDNLNFRPLNSITSRKETGIRIHVESS